jgi:hypothetical protein
MELNVFQAEMQLSEFEVPERDSSSGIHHNLALQYDGPFGTGKGVQKHVCPSG